MTNNATGDAWSLLTEGSQSDSGTWYFEALPAGSYSISVLSNQNWSIFYPTNVDVHADNETYVTIYSVDLREP